jgi:hypothetical protein
MTTYLRTHNLISLPTCFTVRPTCSQGAVLSTEISDDQHKCLTIGKQPTLLFMFVPCINSIKALFIFHNNAHNYKITGILKQLKFRRSLRHVSVHAGTIIKEPFFVLS